MDRPLTLSHHDGYTSRMHWGVPQPETIRNYSIHGLIDGIWTPLGGEIDNYQRLRRHEINADVSAIRVSVDGTHSRSDAARILEIRAE